MWILSVDTSSDAGSIVVSRDETLRGAVETDSRESHSLRLFAAIQFLTHQLHLTMAQFDAFAVTTGPGSFAGLRIGVATIKGFAEMYQKPIVAVSTLEAIAASAVGIEPGKHVVALLDARRSELYAGVYTFDESGLRLLEPDRLENVESFFAAQQKTHTVFVGPDVKVFSPHIEVCARMGWAMQTTTRFLAPAVARVAVQKLKRAETVSADKLSIHYIRRSDAEMILKG